MDTLSQWLLYEVHAGKVLHHIMKITVIPQSFFGMHEQCSLGKGVAV